ncbi:flagellar motor stator protein MotA [Gorillibacterium sp. sgz5001074]|uniref:flagellar motor stator protein MotA n=1 Tax=Gorillibacterium sp. sgz5001074 TaxID=3446695 RepID=UPI003F67ADE2
MEKSTLIGLVSAVIAVGLGMVMKGANLAALYNPAAYLIIFLGTFAALCMAFPMADIKKMPTLFKLIFKHQKRMEKQELIEKFVEWGTIARREGLLALEVTAESVEDPFLKNGMKMLIDGSDSEFVRDVMLEDIHAMEERHRVGAQIFSQAGTYAPTLGVLGAVVGLIAALGNLNDIEKLGHSIAAAFIATLFGIFSGYVLWHPIANKLKRLSKEEVEIKLMMVEGLITFGLGGSANSIRQKLLVFLPSSQRNLEAKEGAAGGKEAKA